MRGRNVGKFRGLSVAKCEVVVTCGQVGALYFIGPDTEAQGGSVYPHDPREDLKLLHQLTMGEGPDLRKFLWQRCATIFSSVCRNTFFPKMRIFRNFSRYFYTDHPKNHFLLLFILRNFPKIHKQMLKIFLQRPRRRKRVEIRVIFLGR